MIKKIISIALLFVIFACAEDYKVPVRIYNKSKYTVINVYVGTEYYRMISANDHTGYKYYTPKTYEISGQFNSADNTSDFSKDVKLDYFNNYSITINNEGDIHLILEDKK
jgi:hypothetical protein